GRRIRPCRDRSARGLGDGFGRLPLGKVRLEHRLDPRRRRAAVEPRDHAPFHHERQRGHLVDAEALGEIGAVVDVDLPHAQPAPFLAGDVREQTLHPPGRARAVGGEKDELGAFGGHAQPPDGVSRKQRPRPARGYGSGMGSWYWIGVSAGLGAGVGVLVAGAVGAARSVLLAAAAAAALGGAAVGFGIDEWQPGGWGDVAAGAAGGLLGLVGAAQVVGGALRRGGTRGGTALLVGGAAVVVA